MRKEGEETRSPPAVPPFNSSLPHTVRDNGERKRAIFRWSMNLSVGLQVNGVSPVYFPDENSLGREGKKNNNLKCC